MLKAFYQKANLAILSGLSLLPATAKAGPIDSAVNAICDLIGPLVGRSKMVSLVFLIALGVMIFLWWMSENKEGVITWVLRTGIALGIIVNLFTIPSLIGLPPVCSGISGKIFM